METQSAQSRISQLPNHYLPASNRPHVETRNPQSNIAQALGEAMTPQEHIEVPDIQGTDLVEAFRIKRAHAFHSANTEVERVGFEDDWPCFVIDLLVDVDDRRI